jgi:PAS domain S-box-containing protein
MLTEAPPTLHQVTRPASPSGRTIPIRLYLAGLVVVFLIAASGATVYGRAQARVDAQDLAEQQARYGAQRAAARVAEGVRLVRDTVQTTAGNPAVAKIYEDPGHCSLTFAGSDGLEGHLDVLRPDGSLVCSSLPRGGSDGYRGAAWLEEAAGGPIMLAPVRDSRTDRQVILSAAPVPKLGFVVATLDLARIGPGLFESFGGIRKLEFLLVDGDGDSVLTRSIGPARWVNASLAGTPFAQDGDGTRRRDVDGTERVYASAAVSGTGWTVHAGVVRAEALATAKRLERRELMLVLLGLVVFMAAAYFLHRRITRPIERLSEAVRAAVEEGSPNPAPVSGPTEVRALAEQLNRLAGTVQRELEERQRAEKEARASEQHYRVLFEGSPLPKWIHDAETLRFLEVNEAAIAHYGYSREQLLSMTVDQLSPTGERPGVEGRLLHLCSDGRETELQITSHDIVSGNRAARVVVAEDVTEKERLQHQLQQSQRLESLGQLAGGVAHDFNNLLAVILGYTAFVEEKVSGQVREDVGQIREAGERATRLTRQLLAFARREVVRPESLDLTGLVREMDQLLRRTIGEHVRLSATLAPDLWPVMADQGQLEQVLVNLAVNARDAMPEGGTLGLETDNVYADQDYATSRPGLAIGRYVRLRVSDTGTGMPRDVVARAFEPFFTTKPKGEGTGLGLATIYGIVTGAGGHAHIYSEPGIGTTFTVLLPASDARACEPEPDVSAGRASSGGTVLVVEDEEAMLEVTRRILTRNGFTVLTAGKGSEAIRCASDHEGSIDLLLTDVVMPEMLGKEVAERITELRPDIRVLFMSGYAKGVIGAVGDIADGHALIDKPFSEATLIGRVRQVLESHETMGHGQIA